MRKLQRSRPTRVPTWVLLGCAAVTVTAANVLAANVRAGAPFVLIAAFLLALATGVLVGCVLLRAVRAVGRSARRRSLTDALVDAEARRGITEIEHWLATQRRSTG